MYRVLIADDEELVCELLKKLIDWQTQKLQLIAAVQDGLSLQRMIETEKPDIVITDINMPCMDGIELIRWCYERALPVKFIIISGYKQFDYARSALRYHVNEYLLKPIDGKELNEALRQLCAELDAHGKNEEKYQHLMQEHCAFGAFYAREIIEHGEMTQPGGQQAARAGTTDYRRVMLLQVDGALAQEDLNALLRKLAQMTEDFALGCSICTQIFGKRRIYFVLSGLVDSEDFVQCALALHKKLGQLVQKFSGILLTTAFGQAVEHPDEVSASVTGAESAMALRLSGKQGECIFFNARQAAQGQEKAFLTLQEQKHLHDYVTQLDAEGIRQWLSALQHSRVSLLPPHRIWFACKEITECFAGLLKELFDAPIKKDELLQMLESTVEMQTLWDECVQWMLRNLQAVLDTKNSQNNKVIRVAKQYVYENYGTLLRLEDVAEAVYLNPAYFSDLFKRETGQSFVAFLTEYRMEKAKQLLREELLTVNEIAFQVGYADARYFSRLFKKMIGLKPTEYRKLYG